jgi:ABC-type transporter Mla MlaB component
MLRITVKSENKENRILLLEGKVSKQWLEELQTEVERSINDGKKLALDFSKVSYIDEEGARLINLPRYQKIEKRNCSLFIRTLLGFESRGEK